MQSRPQSPALSKSVTGFHCVHRLQTLSVTKRISILSFLCLLVRQESSPLELKRERNIVLQGRLNYLLPQNYSYPSWKPNFDKASIHANAHLEEKTALAKNLCKVFKWHEANKMKAMAKKSVIITISLFRNATSSTDQQLESRVFSISSCNYECYTCAVCWWLFIDPCGSTQSFTFDMAWIESCKAWLIKWGIRQKKKKKNRSQSDFLECTSSRQHTCSFSLRVLSTFIFGEAWSDHYKRPTSTLLIWFAMCSYDV